LHHKTNKSGDKDMNKFKLSLLTVAIAAAGASSFSYAEEQQEQKLSPTEAREQAKANAAIETIEIKGFRRSIVDSINTKRFSPNVVESVSAEDIGKLPDSSIAESISRLPGLTSQRLDGRASRVSIRGFGENESATTFNGREQVSIGDNRGVEFDLYPSEIMSGVTVYKTPNATLEAEGIAGVIDMQTVKPLSRERTLQVSGQFEQTSLDKLNPDGNDRGGRGTISYIDKFADDKVGIAFAYTTMSSPNQEKRWNAWGFNEAEVDGEQVTMLGGAKPFVRSSTLERDSALFVLEAAPTDKLKLTLDALYVDFNDEKILRGIEIPYGWGYGITDDNTEILARDGNFATSARKSGEKLVVRNDAEDRSAELKAVGFNAEYIVNDDWSLEFDVSNSQVDRKIWSMENYSGYGRGDNEGPYDTVEYSLLEGNSGAIFTPTLDYGDFNLVKLGGPRSWGASAVLNETYGITDDPLYNNAAQDGFINAPEVSDELTSFKLAATQLLEDAGIFTKMTYGVSFRDREKSKKSEGYFLTLKDFPAMVSVPEQYRLGTANLDFIGMGNMIAYNSRALVNDGYYNLIQESLTNPDHAAKSWTVGEEILSFYAQADFEAELGTIPMTGNFGLRYLDTKQSSQGTAFNTVDGEVVFSPTDVSHSYSHLLPSLNLTFDIAEDQSIRLGAAQTISRARLDEMHASVSASYNNTPDENGNFWSISGGNPLLEPKEATGVDLTYENYFSEEGYFSAAYYWKDLKNWIFDGRYELELTGVRNPNTGEVPPTSTATGSGKVNGGGGTLHGYELSVTLPLNIISETLDGFGLIASHTRVSQDVSDQNGNAYSLPGLSDSVQTLTGYYDNAGFQIRASMRKRSDFKGDVYGIGFNAQQVDIEGETIVDAQIGYDFGEAGFSSLNGLSIYLQGQNLTDEPFITTQDGRVRDYQQYGRTFLLGFSYKM
jgi:iron complex outermembrane receptor protein